MPVTQIDHTADIRLRSQARSFPSSLLQLSNYMLSLIYVGDVEQSEFLSSKIRFTSEESCVVAFLSDLIYHSDVRVLDFRVRYLKISEGEIYWEGYGEKYDSSKHESKYVIKGATYDRLVVEPSKGIIEITLDI